MRINEILEEAAEQIGSEFKEAVENWQEMWNPEQAAQIILASPEAKPFMRPAFEGSKSRILDVMKERLGKAIQDQAKKLAKK